MLTAIGGLSGTGKSTLACGLARVTGGRVLRSDVVRKRLAGVPPEARLPPNSYTQEASARTYDALLEEARDALRSGASVIVDGVFSKAFERAAVEAVARAEGAPFLGLWLVAAPELLLRRVAARSGDASDATEATVQAQLAWSLQVPASWRLIDAALEQGAVLRAALA